MKPTPAAVRLLERVHRGELVKPVQEGSKGSGNGNQGGGMATIFTPDYAQHVIDFIRDGGLMTETDDIEYLPNFQTICRWRRDPDKLMQDGRTFGEHLMDAREDQAERDIQAIKDAIAQAEKSNDRDRANMLKAKLTALFWLAEKKNPKQYGRKTQLTDEEGRGPPTIVFKTTK